MAYARANMIQTVRDYVSRMCTDVPGMKVLVMDTETTGIVSMVFTQTQVLQHEVFMTDTIERQRSEKMPHLKAVYFVRPTADNVRRIQAELREPRFGEYHLFFSNMARDGMIQQLAEADEHEVVQQVRSRERGCRQQVLRAGAFRRWWGERSATPRGTKA